MISSEQFIIRKSQYQPNDSEVCLLYTVEDKVLPLPTFKAMPNLDISRFENSVEPDQLAGYSEVCHH